MTPIHKTVKINLKTGEVTRIDPIEVSEEFFFPLVKILGEFILKEHKNKKVQMEAV